MITNIHNIRRDKNIKTNINKNYYEQITKKTCLLGWLLPICWI